MHDLIDFSSFNDFDWKLVAMLTISMLVGMYRGALREVITIASLTIAAYLAYLYGEHAGSFLSFVDSEVGKQVAGSIAVFVLLMLVFMITKALVFKVLNNESPGAYDRFVGSMLGMLRGVLMIIAVLVGIEIAPQGTEIVKEEWYKDSVIVAKLQGSADAIATELPQELLDKLKPKTDAAVETAK
jgi:membrane protein required for colicin V production